jgi:hypothetical protein
MLTGILASKRPPPPATGITLVGTKKASIGSTAALPFDFTGLTGGSDTSPSVGDYFLIVLGSGNGGPTIPSLSVNPVGLLGSLVAISSSDSIDSGLRILDGVYEAGSSTGGTMAAETSINGRGYAIVVLRGVNATTPQDTAATTASGTNGSNPVPPAITPVSSGAWIFATGVAGHNDHPATMSIGNMTLLEDVACNSGTYDANVGVASKTDWTTGSFSPNTMNCTAPGSSAHSWTAATLVIRPA